MEFPPNTGFFSPEYIEPTICFTKTKMKIGENYPLEKLPVTELVKKDQVMLEFTEIDLPQSDQFLRRKVTTGANAWLSEDQNHIISGVTGYPKIEFRSVEDNEEKILHVWVDPLFQLSRNRMEAAIIIKPLLFYYSLISSEELYQMLTDEGIVHGVIYKQLNLARECIRKKKTDPARIVLAKGREPTPGVNAYLKFHLEIGPIAGELLKDGSIDFRERKIMVPVSKEQIIATKVPATKGRPGMTVLGERIAQRHGRDIEVETMEEAEYSQVKQQVTATSDGVLSVVNKTIIKVCNKLELPGDIDYSTGNIESRSSVVIHGSVLPGFQVKAGGDLEIKGRVMSTQITGLANVVVKGGITGNVSKITAAGDVDINFIEQGQIRCKGNCIIRKQCYYSLIYSGDNIRCQEQSTVVGGELIAEGSITLGGVGAPGADPAFIGAGISAERLFYSRKLQQRLRTDEESIMQRLSGYTGVARTKKLRSLKGGLEEMKLRYLRINLIPGTGLYSRPLERQNGSNTEQTVAQNTPSPNNSTDIGSISIDVHGTIFSGTNLQIGNRTLTIEKNISGQRFQLDDSGNHIVSIPLGKKQ